LDDGSYYHGTWLNGQREGPGYFRQGVLHWNAVFRAGIQQSTNVALVAATTVTEVQVFMAVSDLAECLTRSENCLHSRQPHANGVGRLLQQNEVNCDGHPHFVLSSNKYVSRHRPKDSIIQFVFNGLAHLTACNVQQHTNGIISLHLEASNGLGGWIDCSYSELENVPYQGFAFHEGANSSFQFNHQQRSSHYCRYKPSYWLGKLSSFSVLWKLFPWGDRKRYFMLPIHK